MKAVFTLEWNILKGRLDALLEADRKNELRGALRMLNRVDVAQYLSELDTEKLLRVFRILPSDISSEVFSYMDDEQREKLISSISDKEICQIVDDMFIDDAVDFLEEMPTEIVKRVLENVSPDTRKVINRFLNYPENSAGSIMTIEFCVFPMDYTVEQAMKEIRRTGLDKETVNTLYVVDADGRLAGSLPLRKLIMSGDDVPVKNIMDVSVVSVGTNDDEEQVAETVRKYDLLAVPVVDKEGKPVGIVTADDIMDVMQKEATEDMELMSALTPADDTYLKLDVLTHVKNRIPWLVIMMVFSILTGLLIIANKGLVTGGAAQGIGVALMACIPMLMDTGGNCGQQSSTLVISGLSSGELEPSDALSILWKELRVSLVIGLIMSVLCFAIQKFLYGWTMTMSVIISCAMLCSVVFSKLAGGLLPLAAKKLKLDPMLTAAPMITTIADTVSLLILFAFAALAA